MPNDLNYYEILAVSEKSTAVEIKKAYFKKARTTHPDINTSTNAQREMQVLNEAYHTLIDPVQRAQYDQLLSEERHRPVKSAPVIDINDLVINNKLPDLITLALSIKKEYPNEWTKQKVIEDIFLSTIYNNRIYMLRHLLWVLKWDPNIELSNGQDLITLAFKLGNLDLVISLLEAGASSKQALKAAITNEQIEIFNWLIERTLPNQLLDNTPLLIFALRKNSRSIIPLLMQRESLQLAVNHLYQEFQLSAKHAANPLDTYEKEINQLMDYAAGYDLQDLNFLRPLNIAGLNCVGVSYRGEPIKRELLIDFNFKGAAKTLVTVNDLANLKDISRRNTLVARLNQLITEQGNLLTRTGELNLVPLWLACNYGDLEVVKFRLANGVNPNFSPSNVPDPLRLAADNNFIDIFKFLILNKKDIFDVLSTVSIIFSASRNKQNEILEFLWTQTEWLIPLLSAINGGEALKKLAKHQNIHYQDEATGDTALHIAARLKNENFIKILLDAGADKNIKNKKGETPYDCLSTLFKCQHSKISELLAPEIVMNYGRFFNFTGTERNDPRMGNTPGIYRK